MRTPQFPFEHLIIVKFPNTRDVADMLARFDMAVEETSGGLRVFWSTTNKDLGIFTGPGAFLDYWGDRAAKGIYEGRKLELFCQTYLSLGKDGQAELLKELRDHVLDDDPKLNQRMEAIERPSPDSLGNDWVSDYLNVVALPYYGEDFELGIFDCLMVLDPSLEPWVAEIRQDVGRSIGLPIQ